MAAATLFDEKTSDGQSVTAILSDTERTLAFWGAFGTGKIDIELQVATGEWLPFLTISGPQVIVLDPESAWTLRLNLYDSNATTSVSAQFGPPTV